MHGQAQLPVLKHRRKAENVLSHFLVANFLGLVGAILIGHP